MVGAAFGAAGQRCMALSTAVMVGEAGEWVHDIAERAAKLKVRQILLFNLPNYVFEPPLLQSRIIRY